MSLRLNTEASILWKERLKLSGKLAVLEKKATVGSLNAELSIFKVLASLVGQEEEQVELVALAVVIEVTAFSLAGHSGEKGDSVPESPDKAPNRHEPDSKAETNPKPEDKVIGTVQTNEAPNAEDFGIKLYEGLERHHDGIDQNGGKVQIKTTMKNSLTFPADHCPDYVLGVVLKENATFEVIYNGPGKLIKNYVDTHRSKPKNNLHNVSLGILRTLSASVSPDQRIALKS